ADLEGQVGDVAARAVVQREVALVQQQQPRAVAVERRGRGVLGADRREAAPARVIRGGDRVGDALDAGAERWVRIAAAGGGGEERVVGGGRVALGVGDCREGDQPGERQQPGDQQG